MTTGTVRSGERGVDFSFARPPAARLLELGYSFVVGYISVPPASPAKNISRAECEAYLAAGLSVLLVWEMSATRATLGAAYGTQDGQDATAAARARGYPPEVTILAADDTGTTTANLPNKIAYMRAFDAACDFDMGIYGGVKILTPLVGVWTIGWVPITAWSWSVSLAKLPNEPMADYNKRGRQAARDAAIAVGAHVLQDTGFYIDNTWAVDPNTVIADFTAWGNPRPQPQPEDEVIDIVRDAETNLDKYCVMLDGTLRPLSGTELKLRKITNSLDLGEPATAAERDAMGVYVGPVTSIPPIKVPPAQIAPGTKIAADLGAGGKILGTIG